MSPRLLKVLYLSIIFLKYFTLINTLYNIIMENPDCYSHFFVNKQNVRSVKNIFNLKLLEKSDDQFLSCVLGNDQLVSEMSCDLKSVLFDLRLQLREKSKQDFNNYFTKNHGTTFNLKSNFTIEPVSKELIFIGCWNALYEIVPVNLFGNQHNLKIFRNLVKVVLFSMKNQHIFLSNFIKDWDFKKHPWNSVAATNVMMANHILEKTLNWVLKNILPAILCTNFFITTCKIDVDENKLHFFWKNQWQSFYDKQISNMIFSKVISRFEINCLGRKVKRKYSAKERLHLRVTKKEIPKLHLVLKPNNNFRPIVRYKNDVIRSTLKYKIKERLNFLRILSGKPQDKLEAKFASFYARWVYLKCPTLYFVKTDLSNAFGSINREKLMKILAEKNLDFHKTQQPLYLKKKYAQIYKELVVEIQKPLLVRAGSTVYEWKEGLVQGYKYSPALSELYYSYMDKVYFSNHISQDNTDLKLFVRVVDDYLYVTSSLKDAQNFLSALEKYRNVNYDKTVVNFPHANIQFSDEIVFLGYSYNTGTLQVNRARNIFTGPMCYKITFSSAISNIEKFLENRIGQSGIQVNSHLFNFFYNSEELIWRHIFLSLCLSANKFCTILGILCNRNDVQKYLDLYKKRVTVKLCNSIIETLNKNKPKNFMFVYCINHFRYLSFKALSLCAKETSRCTGLVPFINIELNRTNCIFGKFREHASRIDKHGIAVMPAVKDVCRRTDLRKIMKEFEVLPNGFECYTDKNFFT